MPPENLGKVLGGVPRVVRLRANGVVSHREVIERKLRDALEFGIGEDPQSRVLDKTQIGELDVPARDYLVGGRGHARKSQARFINGRWAQHLYVAQDPLLRPSGCHAGEARTPPLTEKGVVNVESSNT